MILQKDAEGKRKKWHSCGVDVSRKKPINLVYNFNASISFDQKFYRQDIQGSIAHVTMLAKQGILTEEERDQIIAGLKGILKDVEERYTSDHR